MSESWPFGALRPLAYDVIMADPPWLFALCSDSGDEKSPQGHYACMPIAAINALPVGHLARGDCWLWLWATYPMLPQAVDDMAAWGFSYVTGGPWVKRGDVRQAGVGHRLRAADLLRGLPARPLRQPADLLAVDPQRDRGSPPGAQPEA